MSVSIRSLLAAPVLLAIALGACTDTADVRIRAEHVFDGDSFIARNSLGDEIEIRLFGIDAPEKHQPWSRRSRDALRGLLGGNALIVDTVTVDSYGRTVAVVTLPDGTDVNRAMIGEGHAWVYRRYTDDAALIDLEDEARYEQRGLWRLPPAERIPPWEWRQRNRNRKRSGNR